MTSFPGQRVFRAGQLDRIAFPIGGLGSGMFCFEGTGAFSHWSLRHRPDIFHEPVVFSALAVKGKGGQPLARVLEGPVPSWKFVFPWNRGWQSSAMGAPQHHFGLPRFAGAEFESRFPFAAVRLSDKKIPLQVHVTGWSPFIPGDADATSLPVGAIEYHFQNQGAESIDAVYSFHAQNFMVDGEAGQSVTGLPGGFILRQQGSDAKPSPQGSFSATVDEPVVQADLAWFRGEWFDPLTMLWKAISEAAMPAHAALAEGKPSPGGSLYVPLTLAPGESKTIRLLLAWHVPYSTQRHQGGLPPKADPDARTDFFRPWYAEHFKDVEEVAAHWRKNVAALRQATQTFTDCFYDTTLPGEAIEAVAANLSILKSPTLLRQFDGRLWAWEGCQDEAGSCHGSCTHVWNYAQALPHLFPALERSLRETEFLLSQDEKGHQMFRAVLPIGPSDHNFHAAADGQLGGIIKVHREWRISGDTTWLRSLWPQVRQSLDYCIETWDPDHRGVPVEPHHNTYDIEFWGPDGMCGSFYVAALRSAVEMGRALGDNVDFYEKLAVAGKALLEKELFDGEYFIQKIQWKGLRAPDPVAFASSTFNLNYSTEALALLEKEGPKYQYGTGCLSDGVLGEWLAWASGVPPVLDHAKVESHLVSVHRYNFRADLSEHANPQRPAYAFGQDGGLLLCTWPKRGRLSLPFVYSDEVWTGIEYQAASHLIALGHIEEGIEIVRACRARYEGQVRNPFDEFECGHWYGRALASYALLQAFSGARYDAVDKTLHLEPKIKGDFRAFLSTATGFGTVGVKNGQPFLEVRSGRIDVERIAYRAIDGFPCPPI